MSLEAQFRNVLANLELLMHGKTASFDAPTSGSRERDPRPQGESHPPHLRFRALWVDCGEDVGCRLEVLETAQKTLEGAKKRPKPPEVDGWTREVRFKEILKEGAGWPVQEVAVALNVPASEVREARKLADLNPETGLAFREILDRSAEERKREAERMRRTGMKATQIALVLGVHPDTVRRDLGRKAA